MHKKEWNMDDALLGEKTIAFSIAQEILTTKINIPALPANGRKVESGIAENMLFPDINTGQFSLLQRNRKNCQLKGSHYTNRFD